MLKKSLAIGLSVVMAAEVLTGCSGGSGTTETKAADTGKTEAAASEAATEDSYCVPLYGTVRETAGS